MSKRILATIAVVLFVVLLGSCSHATYDEPFKAAEYEIALHIQLDVGEDIGLIVLDYESGDANGSGGVSNADKSLIKQDQLVIHTLGKQNFDNQDVDEATIRFTIITEYVDPNFENIYPPEYTKPMEPITMDVNWGESYFITITGDKVNGYTATLND